MIVTLTSAAVVWLFVIFVSMETSYGSAVLRGPNVCSSEIGPAATVVVVEPGAPGVVDAVEAGTVDAGTVVAGAFVVVGAAVVVVVVVVVGSVGVMNTCTAGTVVLAATRPAGTNSHASGSRLRTSSGIAAQLAASIWKRSAGSFLPHFCNTRLAILSSLIAMGLIVEAGTNVVAL